MIVTIQGTSHELNPNDDVKIDPSDIDGEFVTLPKLINDYGQLVAEAQGEVDQLKYDLERIEALEDYRVRAEADALNNNLPKGAKPVRLTETQVRNTVITSKRFQKAKQAFLAAKSTYDIIKATLTALHAKQDCLISLGANMRKGEIEPRIIKRAEAIQVNEEREQKKLVARNKLARSMKSREKRKRSSDRG